MGDFLKKVQEELDKGIAVFGVKSREMLNSAKLGTEIWSLREDERQAFEEIGRAVYRMSREKDYNGADIIRRQCKKITLAEADIQAKETVLQKIRRQTRERRER